MGTYVSNFANGMAFMFFIGTALHLSLYGYKTRSNLFLEILFSLLAMLELKELIPAITDISLANTESINIFIDGLAVSACGLCLFELLRPGWNTVKRVIYLATGYVAITLLCLTLPIENMQHTYLLFVILYLSMSLTIVVLFLTSNKRYVSNTTFTTSYTKAILLLAVLGLYATLWITSNMRQSAWLEVSEKMSCILLWLLMIEEHLRQEEKKEVVYEEAEAGQKLVVNVPRTEKRTNRDNGMKDEIDEMEEMDDVIVETPNAEEQAFHFKKQLAKVMEAGMIYRNPRLTINDVANAVGTNRTYLSAYLNSVLHTTFYDYINGYRIEYISKRLLEEESPNKTIEEIAELSGFNSTTTFRRAFQKKTGMTPMNYRKDMLSAN